MWTPDAIAKLQHSTRQNSYATYKEYAAIINDQSRRHMTFRGLFEFRFDQCKPVPIDEVEPAAEIVKRFSTGAMSLGSISTEAHTIARDRDEPHRRQVEHRRGRRGPPPLRAGQGGRDAAVAARARARRARHSRCRRATRSSPRSSRSPRVASASPPSTSPRPSRSRSRSRRARSPAKAGSCRAARSPSTSPSCATRRPGVELISPPPHHDIYSIEDIAQLIHDLKNANPAASISVKLVSEVGVGTVAAGVSKAKSDHVTISGHDGGTGASPWSSIKHAGTPWELGLAETQQTLVAQPPARPHRGAGRRPDEDRPRRGDRRDARRRRVRLRHRAAGGRGLHHDAQVPPEHLPGRAWRRRTRCCAASSRASPSTSSTTSSSSPRKCAS